MSMFARFSWHHWCLIVIAAAFAVSGAAVADEELESPAAGSSAARARELVSQLSADSFSERQVAAAELLQMDEAAIEALNEALNAGTSANRPQLQALLTRLYQSVFSRRLDALVRNPNPDAAARLPDWERYCDILGLQPQEITDKHLKNFAAILQSEAELFRYRMFQPRLLPGALETRTAELSALYNDRRSEAFPVESCAALLLLGSDASVRLPRATSSRITDGLMDDRFARLVEDGSERATLRALLSAWFVRDGIVADRLLLFTMRHGIEGGLHRARAIVDARSRRTEMPFALLTLAALGSPDEDLPRVEALLDEPRVFWPVGGQQVIVQRQGQPPRTSNYAVQTRDIALAVACRLRGLPPAEFGMQARLSADTVFAVESLGFDTDAQRAETHALYRQQFLQPRKTMQR